MDKKAESIHHVSRNLSDENKSSSSAAKSRSHLSAHKKLRTGKQSKNNFLKDTVKTSQKEESPGKTIAQIKKNEKLAARILRGECQSSTSSSHTKIFRKDKYGDFYNRITSDEFCGKSESVTGTSDSFHCAHRPSGKMYTDKGLLKRNLQKELDPIPKDPKWTETCGPTEGWEIVNTLVFLVKDPMGSVQVDRITELLRDLVHISEYGMRIDVLEGVTEVLDYLVETMTKFPQYKEQLVLILKNMAKPIHMFVTSDVITYKDALCHYLGYLGYLLMRFHDDELFDLASKALLWQLAMSNKKRSPDAVKMQQAVAASASGLYDCVVRMLALAKDSQFPTYLNVAYILACDNKANCLEMIDRNIIEHIFYRFNPRFPNSSLPRYDINPAIVRDYNLKLGASSVNISVVLSLLLILSQTLKEHLEEYPEFSRQLICPDSYAQRCFAWAFRYECRAPDHTHERNTMTVIFIAFLHIYGSAFNNAAYLLAEDVMALSIQTEVYPKSQWTQSVSLNIMQSDVEFKRLLIHLSIMILHTFPCDYFMVESQHWLVGLMYLLDPGLCQLRPPWSQALFVEIRKTALQALVYIVPKISPKLVEDCGLIRRIMWYIEWYSESPYELNVLYWCVRLLKVSIFKSADCTTRRTALKTLFDTHGIVIIINLVYTLLRQKLPPVEKSQVIIALSLRLITSCVRNRLPTSCCVYPRIRWPNYINVLSEEILDVVLHSLEKHYLLSDRFLVALLNFIWEGVIWNDQNRKVFIENNGIYKLLDLITMTRPAVQSIALAVTCDATRAGDAVGQLVTWRANLNASLIVQSYDRPATV